MKRRTLPTREEGLEILRNTPGFLESLTDEQREIALNAPPEAETFGRQSGRRRRHPR